ncbi:bifunctional 5,10-methylenetetrahydrofolate dehydrogenase/5,10-methenyltetrahydrofolate cyclohydrolase [Olsenella sp. DSM 107455]|uniref:Bifunctional protein FolD n=1 Tax=Thermophilibacter gallinarum TaxID=2779357 RepID=A0ABR9QUS5_9ACTN|nr:bifunctional 5,10-methylenetetrahydrofolate dehydrogenase/5,10-methenyltetrahydrofolate cyclohydrolase [Thermophilibacter gallinarum]MBE5024792.1 bifunctional 5,10-methylenetetrahydrofolate dehydrogenase/5,10-methenyltetrahydrofolate cyclohydrolase [Thermophilibacter gallinarum]
MAVELRGAPVAAALTERLAARVVPLAERGLVPTLAIVRVGEREDDLAYERGALKRCERVGIDVRRVTLPADCGQDDLLAVIDRVNRDGSVHGCLMLRPLPPTLDEAAACAALAPEKDVDCATDASLAGVFSGRPVGFPPCTAAAVLEILDHYDVPLAGARVTVVGRSLVIGRPVSLMLQARDATVTMCHSRTRDLASVCRQADVLVVAAGRPGIVGRESVREGQVVVDVGINWDERSARLVGDVDYDAVSGVVDAITPVPGGVGSVTTAVLAKHVVEAAERSCR